MKSQWKTHIMVISYDDLYRAYRAIARMMECCPYEHNDSQGANEWQEPRITAGDGSRTERDCGRRWMTGDGSREIDQGRRMTINLLSYMKLPSYNRARICRHTVFKSNGSTKYNAKDNSALFGVLFRDTESCTNMPESHSYNTDTAHLEAVRDKSSAEQQSSMRRMTVLDSQRPLPRPITVPEMQEQSTMNCIHQYRRLAVVQCACREAMANAPTDE